MNISIDNAGVDSLSKKSINCYHLRELAMVCGMKCMSHFQVCLTQGEVGILNGSIHDSKVSVSESHVA